MKTQLTFRARLLLASLLLGFVTLLLGLGEALVRHRERSRLTVPGTMPFLFYRHERLGYALVHNLNYFGWASTDSSGFRNDGRPDEPASVTIFADGGSTTFDGNTGADSSTWPARLERYLAFDSLPAVRVVNVGVPGYRVIDNTIRLQTELFRYRPQVVLLLQGHNDLFRALRGDQPPGDPDRPQEIRNFWPLSIYLARHSLLFSKIRDRLNVMGFRARGRQGLAAVSDAAEFQRRIEQGAEDFARDLRIFVATSRTLGIRPVLMSLASVSTGSNERNADIDATWRAAVPFASTDVVLEGYRRYNEVIRQVSAELEVVMIDASQFAIGGPQNFDVGDPIHFSAAGADAFAQQVAVALRRSGALVFGAGSGE